MTDLKSKQLDIVFGQDDCLIASFDVWGPSYLIQTMIQLQQKWGEPLTERDHIADSEWDYCLSFWASQVTLWKDFPTYGSTMPTEIDLSTRVWKARISFAFSVGMLGPSTALLNHLKNGWLAISLYWLWLVWGNLYARERIIPALPLFQSTICTIRSATANYTILSPTHHRMLKEIGILF